TDLRNNLPKTGTSLLDVFKWAAKPNKTPLSDELAAATAWDSKQVAKLLADDHFDLNSAEDFRSEINLVKLRKAFAVANKIGMDTDRLFSWAQPTSKFSDCRRIAEDIRQAVRARFDQTDWEQAAKPLNDQLREHQKLALIAYLLVRPVLRAWGVTDA